LQTIDEQLMAFERERCAAIVAQDFERLQLILSPLLIHTHTRGNTDTRESYLRYLKNTIEMLDVKRVDLKIVMLADSVALMHGKQINRARLRGAMEEVTVESTVTQVWVCSADGAWQLTAFHATSLGAPPPAICR